MLRSEEPDAKDTAKLQNDYEVTKKLAIDGVVKPLELVLQDNVAAVIFEDFDGEPLTTLISKGKIGLEQFLKIAIGLAEILGDIHEKRIIHKDIKPQSILIDTATQKIKLINFSVSSLFPGESSVPVSSVEMVEESLSYISPEQTGRMNRIIDYRSDLYSLGIVFYEMLVGEVPFRAEDPLELVHSHMAKVPVSPRESDQGIPGAVSNIIMKLLSKAPERRYQSTHGLKVDLERCLYNLQSLGEVGDFPPGEEDRSPLFSVSRSFYGRKTEMDELNEAFTRAKGGGSVFALISGHSGIGKTSLEREFHESLVSQSVIYITGKFEQLRRDIPYSGFIHALKELIDRILMEPEAQVWSWKEEILRAVGPNGQIIIDVIPQIELIIGQQEPVPELQPSETQNRFNTVFQNFLGVFSKGEQPLIIFLDDLQWADPASLTLLKILASSSDIKYLLLVTACRDDEPDLSHEFEQFLGSLEELSWRTTKISVGPLGENDVKQIVSDTLKCTEEEAHPLARMVYDKTEGNPFFINEFLNTLYKDNFTSFNFRTGRWGWDLGNILKADIIHRLSKKGQWVLQLAACIGNNFTLGILAQLYKTSPPESLAQLQESIAEGLVLSLGYDYSHPHIDGEERLDGSEQSFSFFHDRIHQAVYSLLSTRQKQRLHLRIGNIMLESTEKEQKDQVICEITDHLNKGRALVKEQEEKYELAELNLVAGRKAKASIAYGSAQRYITAGMEMLSEESWNDRYELALALHVEGAEVAYLCGVFSRADELNRLVLMRAKTLLDRVKPHEIMIQSCFAQNKYKEAVEVASKILNQLGVFLPRNPGRMRILLGLLRTKLMLHGISPDDLFNLPQMTDQYKLAAMRLLMTVFNPFYKSIREMFPSIAFRMIILSFKYGNSYISPFAYALYGLLLGLIGEIEPGCQFGEFALDLFQRYNTQALKAKMYNVYYALIKKWNAHLGEALEPLLEAYRRGLETGDFEWAAHAVRGYCIQLFFTGSNLEIVMVETEKYSETLGRIKQENTLHSLMLVRQVALNLTGRAENVTNIRGKCFNDDEMLPLLIDANDTDTIAGLRFFQCMLCYLFEDYRGATATYRDIEKYHETRGQFGFVLEMRFYYTLVLLALYPTLKGIEKTRTMKTVATYQKMLKKGAEHASMNYLHKWHLVEAERERLLGRRLRAMEHYDQAIQGAKENDYIQDEALANELAAKFYLKSDRKNIAAAYVREAHLCYRRWGAGAKVRELEEKYGEYLLPPSGQAPKKGESVPVGYESAGIKLEELDLATVLKVSQMISGEIVLASLLEKMMKIVIEVSGAGRGLLILEKEGEFFIEAEGDASTEKVRLLKGINLTLSDMLSHAVVNYVIRTKQNIVLKDAFEDELFHNDPYITEIKLKSLLCAPIVHQGLIKGIIYLENNLTGGAFSEDRVEIVKLIASQAAISLENARLYQSLLVDIERRKAVEEELRSSEQMARALLDALRDSLVLIDRDGLVLSLNKTKARSLAMKSDEIVGRHLWDLFPPKVAERRKAFVERAVRSVKAIRVVDKQEGKVSDNVIYPIVDLDGKVTRIAILERDITEQKKVEEQAKLQQRHLMRSDRLAMMGELAAGVAHEINNPNHTIMLNTALLLKAYPDILSVLDDCYNEDESLRFGGFEYTDFRKTLQDSVKRIDECAKRIGVIVKELKGFARTEPEDYSESVDINVTVQSALLLGTPFVKKSTDNFTVQMEENLPKVLGNAQKIEQVLLNLLQNACQSLQDRREGISVGTRYDRDRHLVIIEITDQGEGMPEEVLSRAMEPFFTTKRGSGGTGLGLSISARIVEEHGGTLKFRSQPGKGTVASVCFPEGEFK
jgi:PAS domain S-box-containing protein